MRATSTEAYYEAGELSEIHSKVILRTLKQQNRPLIAEEIAKFSGLRYDQVWRRMSELERDNKVTCTDETSLTSSNRRAFKWRLIEQ